MTRLCSCGSGKRFERCHGDPRNEYARIQALEEARRLAVLFPSVRLRSDAVLAFAERVAGELGDHDDGPSDELLAEGVELVPAAERRELVAGWADVYPEQWRSLAHASGDPEAAEREVAAGALDVAIAERRPTPLELVDMIEDERMRAGPALALLVPPYFVWAFDEANVAAAATRGRPPADAFRVLDDVASGLVRESHLARLRALSAMVAAELPFPGRRRSSRALSTATARVRTDAGFARAVSALLLSGYVSQLPGEPAAALN